MDEKEFGNSGYTGATEPAGYSENKSQTGYDKNTFGELGQSTYASQQNDNSNSYAQGYQTSANSTTANAGSTISTDSSGCAIASMVLGILSLVLFCTCVNIPLAILSVVFGIIHVNRKNGSIGCAIAGIAMSCISVLLTIILVIIFVAFGSSMSEGTSSEFPLENLPFDQSMLEDFESYEDESEYDYDYGDDSYEEDYFYGDFVDNFDYVLDEENDV